MSAKIYALASTLQAQGIQCIAVAATEDTAYIGEWLKLLAGFKDFTYRMQVAHWNVRSSKFQEMHNLFQEWYNNSFMYEDQAAEQVKMLDISFEIPSEQSALLSMSVIKSDRVDSNETRPRVFLKELLGCLKDLKAQVDVLNGLAEQNKDIAGIDLLGQMAGVLNKGLWFVRAYLKK